MPAAPGRVTGANVPGLNSAGTGITPNDKPAPNPPTREGLPSPTSTLAPWSPLTVFQAGQCAIHAGILYQNQGATFTSAATWSLDASKWTALTAAGTELAYAATTANQTGIPAGGVDLTGLSISFVMPNRPVLIELWTYAIGSTAAGSADTIIVDPALNVYAQTYSGSIAANGFSPTLTASAHLVPGANANGQTLTPGTTYTLKGHASVSGGGSGTLYAGGTYPAFIRAAQL